jgi:ankyrin repeat protein
VRMLVESKALVNAADNEGQTPLWAAACEGHTQIVRMLVESKALVNAADNKGQTPLDAAVRNGHKATEHVLLNLGVTPLLEKPLEGVFGGNIYKCFIP